MMLHRTVLLAILVVAHSLGASIRAQDEQAVAELRAQAEAGDAEAQFNLAYRYDFGEGVPEDDAEAVRWYRLAAEQEDATAQYNLGVMYMNGRGVPQDDVTAHMWLNLAASRSTGEDREQAAKLRDAVAERLTPEGRSEAQMPRAGVGRGAPAGEVGDTTGWQLVSDNTAYKPIPWPDEARRAGAGDVDWADAVSTETNWVAC